MASYPNTIVSLTNPGGTSPLASGPDHAALHTSINNEVIAIETTVGTTAGTNVLKAFAAGEFPVRINGATGIIQTIPTGGTFNGMLFGTPTLQSPTITGLGTNSGTIANGVYGTPAIDVINARNSGTALGFGNSMYPAVGTISDSAGGTLTVNAQASQVYYCAMGTSAGNRTIATPTNISAYQQLTYAFKSSGSANGTLVWGTVFRISQDFGTPTLGTGTSWNMYSWRYNAVDSKFDFMGQIKNLI